MAYLIDGNNLLGVLFPGHLKDPENKLKLVRRLIAFGRFKKTRVILVFDGLASADVGKMITPKSRFEIVHPPAGETADAAIMEIVSRQTDVRRFFVVSSDRGIKTFARLKGAKALGSGDFSTELKQTLKEHKRAKEMEKDAAKLSSLEVNFWMEVFKKKK
jgi:predicted RNA-binding protein with PIN domain